MRLLRMENNKNNIYNYEQTLRGGQTHATRVTSPLQGKQQDTTASRGQTHATRVTSLLQGKQQETTLRGDLRVG